MIDRGMSNEIKKTSIDNSRVSHNDQSMDLQKNKSYENLAQLLMLSEKDVYRFMVSASNVTSLLQKDENEYKEKGNGHHTNRSVHERLYNDH